VDIGLHLRSSAERLGLDGIGVCDVTPFDRTAIDDAVVSGRSAGMRFTFTEPASTDVTSSFPWARRIVAAAWSYLDAAGSPPAAMVGTTRIARFATADHYASLRRRLESLAQILTTAGFRAAILIDDNRLVDRAAAVGAGVGWWGKNTMVLAPGAGPWLLLGSIVTDAPLEVSAPMVRDCGTCEACLPACPTGALVAPGVLDSRRCLAYWAQAPGPIPLEFRQPLGDRLYGCDDCLEACPPGRRALEATPVAATGRRLIADVLSAADVTLLSLFGHFYIPRRDPRYLRRNALVALGNVGSGDDVPVVAGYLGHPDPLLRSHAAWALGSLGGGRSRAALAMAATSERHPAVAEEIAQALGRC
jgi:epoxyqueuosine reductase